MADKAFLSGINDYKTIGDLRGCVNDTESIRRLLVDEFVFDPEQIRVKTDAEVTKPEMIKGWKWLLRGAKPGDRLVFHFSGHGSYTADASGESGEADFRDELLCLYGMDWNDPKSYLLDDELAKWTTEIPEGVHVTFLLDCCHSGTGTRFIQPDLNRAAKSDFASAASLSLEEVAQRRAEDTSGKRTPGDTRGLRPASQSDIGRKTVLARFAPPPVSVQVAIENAKKKRSFRDVFRSSTKRDGSEPTMNHVLWSGCRDDQTSADAFIEGDFHGAFTYHFSQAVRTAGEKAKADDVLKSLRSSLVADGFDQVPQLEPTSTAGHVFGSNDDRKIDDVDPDEGKLSPATLTSKNWGQLISILQQIADHLTVTRGESGRTGGSSGLRARGRSLVYVHGICEHKAGYSDGWFDAMTPHLTPSVLAALKSSRMEVLWSEHVSKTNRGLDRDIDPVEKQNTEMMLRAILEERMVREAAEQIAERGTGRGLAEPMPRAVLGIPGLDCVDDFVRYLSSDRIRKLVISEATNVLRPLLQQGDAIELISHSWGTVVACEALHVLQREGLPGRIHNWFTVGAALAISFVAKQLRPNDGRKPTMVDHWINLDARGDGVGGSILATGMHVDREYLRLEPVGCKSTFGLVSPACAHSSYFNADNDAVNRDIFAHWMEQALS